jgi:hypothetical protein
MSFIAQPFPVSGGFLRRVRGGVSDIFPPKKQEGDEIKFVVRHNISIYFSAIVSIQSLIMTCFEHVHCTQ